LKRDIEINEYRIVSRDVKRIIRW